MTAISNYLNNDFRALQSDEIVSNVQDFFLDVNFSHFPVIEEEIFIGNIACDDIENFDSEKTIKDYRYALEVFFVHQNTLWIDVLEVFAQNHCNIVPVLNENNSYVGYYEITDVINFLYETPFLMESGAVIIVEKDAKDYSMGQIVQIVESNNAKLLGVFLSNYNGDKVQVTIKIATGGVNEIVQSFRRYEYEIISQHEEDNYLANLKERSEYLDKYLNL
jgi:Mg/Co/Ni transporter MgtE